MITLVFIEKKVIKVALTSAKTESNYPDDFDNQMLSLHRITLSFMLMKYLKTHQFEQDKRIRYLAISGLASIVSVRYIVQQICIIYQKIHNNKIIVNFDYHKLLQI